jgi:hypothetical protein
MRGFFEQNKKVPGEDGVTIKSPGGMQIPYILYSIKERSIVSTYISY